jgi:hypothetical protein
VHDLFDKVVWDETNIKVVEKCKGLQFNVPIVYSLAPVVYTSQFDLFAEKEPEEPVAVYQAPKSSFSPARQIKRGGF